MLSDAAIPGPPGHWLVGNLGDIDVDNTAESLCSLTRTYGPIWKFHLGSEERIVIGSQALMDEVCDEGRFTKVIAAVLKQARNGVRDGLGTAHGPEERNWGIAHRILAPHFAPLAIENMFGDMHDIAGQLVLKWARHGPERDIHVTEDFTRLTLDAIALSAMDYRFNSFYKEAMHPFIDALASFLNINGDRAKRSAVLQPLCVLENHKYWGSIERLRETGYAVISARKMHPSDKKDLLNAMLHGIDPESGERMTDDSVVNNMITFLFAGHETTSGLLSFTFYYLLSNPAAYARARREVDDVLGDAAVTAAHLARLPYLSAVLRESLRLSPTVPAIALAAKENTTLGGKYQIKANAPIVALFAAVHRDPRVYGSDADAFRPERMLDEHFHQRNQEFPNCWKPFGNGLRGCIGRSFAWQQALLVTAMLLQSFDLSMSDPSYRLKIKQTLTIKPDGFRMRARPRHRAVLPVRPRTTTITGTAGLSSTAMTGEGEALKTTIDIYYGSNTNTCKQLASRLADHAADRGFAVGTLGALDAATKGLSRKNPVVLVAASYNGQPASNAARFVDWIGALRSDELAGVVFAVFGCGHRDWAKTFLRVPTYLDQTLHKCGGTRLAVLGTSDVADGKVLSDFSAWEEHVLWPALRERYGVAAAGTADETAERALQVKVHVSGTSALRCGLQQARVFANTTLPGPDASARKHLEITLPPGTTYRTGDRLAILPQNPGSAVRRALKRLGLSQDSILTVASAGATSLPVDVPIRAAEVLRAYVELQQPATESDVCVLLKATCDESSKTQLSRLAKHNCGDEAVVKRPSVLDLLELFPTIGLSLDAFLAMQPPMRARKYCISSSPLWNPSRATVTLSAVHRPPTRDNEKTAGTASAYLSSLAAGDEVFVSIEGCAEDFRLPEPADDVPLIMIAAGTGLAPFRGFVQERAAQMAAGRALAAALLFYGCRSLDDDPYAESLKRWEQLGAVSVRRAYSRAPEQSQGCRHVQDRVSRDEADFVNLFAAGARLAVCVPECAAADVRRTLVRIIEESRAMEAQAGTAEGRSKGVGTEAAERHLDGVGHVWTPQEPAV
ncbi:hypothetical protein E8E11_005303 [Didymella keratinophila]|nr:hypothetical protein E8E11_005303 [Didymella keratinophila]